jgi:hypothetical protein
MHWSALTVLPLLACSAAAKERPYGPPRLKANHSLVHILEGARERELRQ